MLYGSEMAMISALLLVMATPASAAPAEIRLSPAEVEQVLDEAAKKREAGERAAEKLPPQIHGEIGFSIGTGGYRSAHGTAVVELPDDGFASFTFGTTDPGDSRRRTHRRDR